MRWHCFCACLLSWLLAAASCAVACALHAGLLCIHCALSAAPIHTLLCGLNLSKRRRHRPQGPAIPLGGPPAAQVRVSLPRVRHATTTH